MWNIIVNNHISKLKLMIITISFNNDKGLSIKHPTYSVCIFTEKQRLTEELSRVTGVENVGGDIFESIPNGDAIFMKVCFEFENDIFFLTKFL